MMHQKADSWDLRDDLAAVLSQEVSSWASRTARLTKASDSGCAGYTYVDCPTDDRSEWRLDPGFFGADSGHWATTGSTTSVEPVGPDVVCFDRRILRTPGHVLSMVMVVLSSSSLGSRGVRWRLAARIVETAHPIVEQRAAGGEPESTRLLPLFKWVRWRLLSEPFREPFKGDDDSAADDERPCDVGGSESAAPDPDGPLAYAGGAFTGCKSLRRRARHSRTEWAETLLTYQDHPVLSRIKVEHEGRLLVFTDEERSSLIDFGGSSTSDRRFPPVDDHFVSWYAREFFSRRFMVYDMWRTIRRRLKWFALAFFLLSVTLSVAVGGVLPNASPDPLRGEWTRREPLWWVATAGAVALAMTMLILVAGVVNKRGNERFAFPFLLRFAAGTVLGSAAVVAARAVWIARLSESVAELPSDCPKDVPAAPGWVTPTLVVGLVAVGLLYMVFEASIHGSSGWATRRRAAGVWLIGVGWALIVAAIAVVVLSPTFTECFPIDLYGGGRRAAYVLIALTSLDLGIFLQVLWEDRPVTYPLGALRFSRHG